MFGYHPSQAVKAVAPQSFRPWEMFLIKAQMCDFPFIHVKSGIMCEVCKYHCVNIPETVKNILLILNVTESLLSPSLCLALYVWLLFAFQGILVTFQQQWLIAMNLIHIFVSKIGCFYFYIFKKQVWKSDASVTLHLILFNKKILLFVKKKNNTHTLWVKQKSVILISEINQHFF